MRAHFIYLSDPTSITRFLANFKIACDSSRIHQDTAAGELLFLVKNAQETTLNRRRPAATNIAQAAVFV